METRTCERCDRDITFLHGNRRYCEECAKENKKEYNIEYSNKYNKQYMKQFPKSARGEYYQYYKFIKTFTSDEIRTMVTKKKNDIKYAKESEIRELRTQIKLLTDVYKILRRKKMSMYYQKKDKEHQKILNMGYENPDEDIECYNDQNDW